MIAGKRVLVTGGSGQTSKPVIERLVRENEVWVAARFTDATRRAELEALGAQTVVYDLESGSPSGLPVGMTHVFHSAIASLAQGQGHDHVITTNAESLGLLMHHYRDAEAFVLVSTIQVYQPQESGDVAVETDPLGTVANESGVTRGGGTANAGFMGVSAYPLGKITAEAVARTMARVLDLPTTIARLDAACGAYKEGGFAGTVFSFMLDGKPIPLPEEHENSLAPISSEDIGRLGSGPLFEIASVPATIVNWGGDERISVRDLVKYIEEISGITATFETSPHTTILDASDNTRRLSLIGPCLGDWRADVRRTIEMVLSKR